MAKCSGCGCGGRKAKYMPLAGGWYCRDCSSATGMSAPKNQAAANSKKWQSEPCRHQSVANSVVRKGGHRYHREICRRCGKQTVFAMMT
jgi:hypothetical protein